jgi:hypothetical protein
VPTSTVSDTRALSQYFQDFSFTVGFLEDIPDLENFDEPISRNLVWKEDMRFHAKKLLSTKL